MKETRTINLNGLVFHIDNDAYQTLNDYLQDIELRLPADERADVMADIEARVCELLQSALFAKNVQVVNIEMINAIKERIGAPSEFGAAGGLKRPKVKTPPQYERSGCGRVLKITLEVILALIAIQILLPVLVVVFALCMAGLGLGLGAFGALPLFGMPFFDGNWPMALLVVISSIVAIGLPIGALVYTIVSHARNHRGPKGRFWLIAIICWLISLACFTFSLAEQATSMGGINGLVHSLMAIDRDEDAVPVSLDALPAFNAVKVSGAVDVSIIQGDEPAMVTDTNNVRVEVIDSVLCISCKPETDGCYSAEVVLQDLTSLHISGASNAELKGEWQEVSFIVSGASKLEAEDAFIDIVHVNCSGASNARVYAAKELWAQATGASKITYYGNPTVKHTMAVGASKIKKD